MISGDSDILIGEWLDFDVVSQVTATENTKTPGRGKHARAPLIWFLGIVIINCISYIDQGLYFSVNVI